MSKTDLHSKAVELRKQHPRTHDLVLAIRNFLENHLKQKSKRYKPKSILESRFTLAEEAFEKGMGGCGAIANMAAAMLRHVGVKVRLVHGEHAKSVDHAWILVYEPESGRWIDYDLAGGTKEGYITNRHKRKFVCDNWEEIRSVIERDHQTYKQREKERG